MFTGMVGMMAFAVGGVMAADSDWNQFRGPGGTGVDAAAGYPVEFSTSRNVAWKVAVPYGQSSPVLAGGRLYLTASEPGRLLTISMDAKSGKEMWRAQIPRAQFSQVYKANDPASPTPVADSNGVVVFFPDFGLAAYGTDGKERWKLPLGPFKNFYGMAASPILVDDLIILVCDQQNKSFVLGVDRRTGAQRWKTERPGATIGWATPAVFRPSSGPAQLIVLGSTRVDGFFLTTGEPRWWMPVASMGSHGTPLARGDAVFVLTAGSSEPWLPTFESELASLDKDGDGRFSTTEFLAHKELGDQFGWLDTDDDKFITAKEWNEARSMGVGESGAIAIRADKAQGKLDPQTVVWRFKKNLPYIPAPLVYGDVFYMVRDGGIITALDPATGGLLKEGRNRDAIGQYYASPVAADGKVYVASVEGKVTVLKAGRDWQVLATNDLGEELHASPALGEGRLYIRTRGALYCFRSPR